MQSLRSSILLFVGLVIPSAAAFMVPCHLQTMPVTNDESSFAILNSYQVKLFAASSKDESDVGAFGKFKDVMYDAIDGTKGLLFQKGKEQTPVKPIDGYALKISREDEIEGQQEGPGQRILKQYENESFDEEEVGVFGQTKDIFYGAVDALTVKKARKDKQGFSDDVNTLKAISKASTNEVSSDYQKLSPLLESTNPIQRMRGEMELKRIEELKLKRKRDAEREVAFNKLKDTAFGLVDTVNSAYNIAAETPQKLAEVAKDVEKTADSTIEAVQKIPSQLENTLDEIKGIPSKIEQKGNEVKDSIENAQRITTEVVDDVRSIPSNVKKTIDDAKFAVEKSISDTNNKVESISKAVENVSTTVKVMTGVEKPKPPPPPPPPPPKTKKEIALDIAGNTAKGALNATGKAVWFATKSAAGFTKNTAEQAINAAVEKRKEAKLEEISKREKLSEEIDEALVRARKAAADASKSTAEIIEDGDVGKQISDTIDADLGREVSDALGAAKAILDEEDTKDTSPVKSFVSSNEESVDSGEGKAAKNP